ncbi:hypothetical protein BGZ63DRAFT_398129 [Mariannaea sp. PMI_226]|nr:hypothetical protein BGZ63DRAFT_398129 [Mariannaea sp. PMI_226]
MKTSRKVAQTTTYLLKLDNEFTKAEGIAEQYSYWIVSSCWYYHACDEQCLRPNTPHQCETIQPNASDTWSLSQHLKAAAQKLRFEAVAVSPGFVLAQEHQPPALNWEECNMGCDATSTPSSMAFQATAPSYSFCIRHSSKPQCWGRWLCVARLGGSRLWGMTK